MDKQKVFDKVVNHLLTQNKQSIEYSVRDGETSCAYRGADGLMCAVGCLIADSAYDEILEGASSDTFSVTKALIASGIDVEDKADKLLLRSLQLMHDGLGVPQKKYKVKEWPEGLKYIAEKFNLEYKGLTV
jgi:hypothetical protein